MKKMNALLVALMLLTLLPTAGFAALLGSGHDFTDNAPGAEGWATGPSGQEACVPCHTPHNSLAQVPPIWNHEAPAGAITPYTDLAGTLSAPDPAAVAPASLGCMSCHDGATNIDAFGGAAVPGGTVTIATAAAGYPASKNLGTDLSTSHPVSINYQFGGATDDWTLVDPGSASPAPFTGNIDTDFLKGPANDQVECASCHDVHNRWGNPFLLLVDNANSALCLVCHGNI